MIEAIEFGTGVCLGSAIVAVGVIVLRILGGVARRRELRRLGDAWLDGVKVRSFNQDEE